ncbi:hypothetical protein CO046_03300 [Candidatus Peregrinibacteria bacterium CG_4_9_14_0_2_um_filter_53_11]|nr:MAG: hypothetical protein CO046_03300 [Candidatus Peregrinibacteria bacterium CG_4_9_14_0_2_um_filter_53_11]
MDTEDRLTKKERREKHREEQREMKRMMQQRKPLQQAMKWIVAPLVIVLLGYGIYTLYSLSVIPKQGESIAIQGREHIPVDYSSTPEYNSNPPTSGPHYVEETDWGVYQEELEDGNVIHSMEHGGIWISYQPSLDEETKAKLEAIGKNYPGSVVVSPRSANDSPIALASWGRLEKLTEFDEDRIVKFIKGNKNNSPEPFAR